MRWPNLLREVRFERNTCTYVSVKSLKAVNHFLLWWLLPVEWVCALETESITTSWQTLKDRNRNRYIYLICTYSPCCAFFFFISLSDLKVAVFKWTLPFVSMVSRFYTNFLWILQALIHGLNRHYYSITINYRKNELEQKVIVLASIQRTKNAAQTT